MTFLDKYQLLKKSIPVQAFTGIDLENCDLTDYTNQSRNCYFCFDSFKLENSIYCFGCIGKNLVDCRLSIECELSYECMDCNNCYGSTYLQTCNSCRDCHFSALCMSCSDCFGCVGLSNKKYCILNNQLTKEKYEETLVKIKGELRWRV